MITIAIVIGSLYLTIAPKTGVIRPIIIESVNIKRSNETIITLTPSLIFRRFKNTYMINNRTNHISIIAGYFIQVPGSEMYGRSKQFRIAPGILINS